MSDINYAALVQFIEEYWQEFVTIIGNETEAEEELERIRAKV